MKTYSKPSAIMEIFSDCQHLFIFLVKEMHGKRINQLKFSRYEIALVRNCFTNMRFLG